MVTHFEYEGRVLLIFSGWEMDKGVHIGETIKTSNTEYRQPEVNTSKTHIQVETQLQCIAAVKSEIQHSSGGVCFVCFIDLHSYNERITGLCTHAPIKPWLLHFFACQTAGMWQTKSLQNTKWCGTYKYLPLYSMMHYILYSPLFTSLILNLSDQLYISHCESLSETLNYFYSLITQLHQDNYCIK